MTATPCPRAGCAGEIEDGYCNVCGMAAPASAPPAAAGFAAAPTGGAAWSASSAPGYLATMSLYE